MDGHRPAVGHPAAAPVRSAQQPSGAGPREWQWSPPLTHSHVTDPGTALAGGQSSELLSVLPPATQNLLWGSTMSELSLWEECAVAPENHALDMEALASTPFPLFPAFLSATTFAIKYADGILCR